MKRITISLLALAVSVAAASAGAQDSRYGYGYNDGPTGMRTVHTDRAQVLRVDRVGGPYASSAYEREECWNEQTNNYEDGYYRDSNGRLYRGDGRTNTGGMLIGALIGGALGNTVGKGDGRKAATIGGAVIGGTIGAHAGNDGRDYEYRDDNSGVVRRCRTIVVNGDDYGPSQYPATYERQQCWNEQTNGYEDGYYRDSNGRLYRGDGRTNTGGMLIGALIGGALGNTVGKGDGRTAATIGGAVVGGAIGAHAGSSDRDYEYRDNSGVTRRCRTVVTTDNGYNNNGGYGGGGYGGYNVTYRYAGQTYQAFTTQRPGSYISVTVDVRPQDYNGGYRR